MDDERFDYSTNYQEIAVARVKDAVYFWMLFEHVQYSKPSVPLPVAWEFDALSGVQSIAWGAAHGLGTWEESLMDRRLNTMPRSARGKSLKLQARCYVNACYVAIRELIAEGRVEVVIEEGWPSLRITRAIPDVIERFHGVEDDKGIQALILLDEQLRTMPYAEYLKTDVWRARRQQHIDAAAGRCQICNTNEPPLHVHHRTYANRGRERFYDLVVLCGACHATFHKSGRKVR